MTPIVLLRPRSSTLAAPRRLAPPTNLLGAQEWTATVYARGGETKLPDLPFSSLQGERVRGSAPSTASVTVPGAVDRRCAQLLEEMALHPRAFELHLYRGRDREWLGPVTGLQFPEGSGDVTVQAQDVSWWSTGQRLHATRVERGDAAEAYANLLADGFQIHEDVGVTIAWAPVGVAVDTLYSTGAAKLIRPLLDDLAKEGVQATVLGRTIFVGGAVPLPEAAVQLVDQHFSARPAISVDASAANDIVVAGGASSDTLDPVSERVAATVEAIAADGVFEGVVRDPAIVTPSQAQGRAAALAATGTIVQFAGGALDPSAPIVFDELVPGALVGVALADTVAPVAGVFELVRVRFSASPGAEQVAIEVQPPVTS